MTSGSSGDQTDRTIDYPADQMPYVDGFVYEQRDGKHLIQLHYGKMTAEFEVADEQVAAAMKGVGTQILSEMDSPMAQMALSPAEANHREEELRQTRIEETGDDQR